MLDVWHELFPLAISTGTRIGLPVTVALAAVALIGYVFGQRTRSKSVAALDERRQQELERAARIAWQLETIATALRQDLVAHHAQVSAFKRQLRQARDLASDAAWEQLCNEAEAMLGPTMQLAHQLSHAYDQIRQQSDALETFTHGRTDPLTGVGNGRALEQQLRVLQTAAARGNGGFAIALVSLDRDTSTLEGRSLAAILPLLPKLAGVIRSCMRDTDFVARYGDEEFVIVMPQTSLAGASVFGSRLKRRVADELSATVCSGITEVLSGDDSRSLLARADSALYSAKAAGPNRLFVHTGTQIRPYVVADESASDARETTADAGRSSLQVVADDDDADADEAADLVTSGQPLAI
jgi:diguanylate cyclase (GGDEF)-like protein